MALKEGYQLTEVGVIPKDWGIKKIGDFCLCFSGGTPSTSNSNYYGGNIPWITSTDLNKSYIFDVMGRITSEGLKYSSAKIVKKNTLLIALYGATAGVSAISNIQGAVNQAILAILPKNMSNNYLFQYLKFKKKYFINIYTQGGQPNFSGEIVKSFLIPFPIPLEQQAIANVLGDTDDLIEALQKLIDKKRLVKQGVMQELLRPKEAWKSYRLGEICKIKTGNRNNQDKAQDGKYFFFVRSANAERINSYSYDCEAILVPGEGNIGNIFHYIKGRFDVHQRVYAINQFFKEICGKFIYFYMTKNFGKYAMQNSVKATVDSLRLPTFQNFEIHLPSLKEQQAIADVLTNLDDEITALEVKLDKLRLIKQGMMDQLLTGAIRLV